MIGLFKLRNNPWKEAILGGSGGSSGDTAQLAFFYPLKKFTVQNANWLCKTHMIG
jgi:hypothetical protein